MRKYILLSICIAVSLYFFYQKARFQEEIHVDIRVEENLFSNMTMSEIKEYFATEPEVTDEFLEDGWIWFAKSKCCFVGRNVVVKFIYLTKGDKVTFAWLKFQDDDWRVICDVTFQEGVSF